MVQEATTSLFGAVYAICAMDADHVSQQTRSTGHHVIWFSPISRLASWQLADVASFSLAFPSFLSPSNGVLRPLPPRRRCCGVRMSGASMVRRLTGLPVDGSTRQHSFPTTLPKRSAVAGQCRLLDCSGMHSSGAACCCLEIHYVGRCNVCCLDFECRSAAAG